MPIWRSVNTSSELAICFSHLDGIAQCAGLKDCSNSSNSFNLGFFITIRPLPRPDMLLNGLRGHYNLDKADHEVE